MKNVKIYCQKIVLKKSGNFASKSKAIGLPFCPKINGIKNVHISCQRIVPKKWLFCIEK